MQGHLPSSSGSCWSACLQMDLEIRVEPLNNRTPEHLQSLYPAMPVVHAPQGMPASSPSRVQGMCLRGLWGQRPGWSVLEMGAHGGPACIGHSAASGACAVPVVQSSMHAAGVLAPPVERIESLTRVPRLQSAAEGAAEARCSGCILSQGAHGPVLSPDSLVLSSISTAQQLHFNIFKTRRAAGRRLSMRGASGTTPDAHAPAHVQLLYAPMH